MRKNKYEEIGFEDFIEKVGEEFVTHEVNPIVLITYEKDNTNIGESVEIDVFYNEKEDAFTLCNERNKELILTIEKSADGYYFIKPLKLLRFCSKQIMRAHIKSPDFVKMEDDVYTALNLTHEGKTEDVMSDYFYYLGIILVDELNLDISRSKLIHSSEMAMIIDGIKEEFLDTNLNSTDMSYILNFEKSSREVRITKIDPTTNTTCIFFDLFELYMDL